VDLEVGRKEVGRYVEELIDRHCEIEAAAAYVKHLLSIPGMVLRGGSHRSTYLGYPTLVGGFPT
jgi:hypothetical protein